MKEYSLKDLGQLVDLFTRGKHFADAQKYLDEMQARVWDAELRQPPVEPKPKTLLEVAQDTDSEPVSEPGPLRDAEGNVTRVSVLAEERGYDPDAHDNKELKILCDGVHIPTAHTADTVEGLVRYYKRDARGRIKTEELRGKVEIRGL